MSTPSSYVQYPSDGVQTTFGVTFPFILRSHVRLLTGWEPLDNSFTSELIEGADFIWVNDAQIVLTQPLPAGTILSIVRETPNDGLISDFEDGSTLLAADLDLAALQTLYVSQEAIDRSRTTGEVALQAQADVASAVEQAAAAEAKADAAVADASAAQAAASQAQSDAAGAVSAANAAISAANAATSAADTATTTANTAISIAVQAETKADLAINQADAANSKADQAIDAVSSALPVTLVANVAAIPGSPDPDELVEVGDSTGIESFAPLTGLPAGFVGDAGLRVRIQWSGSTWEYRSYAPNDPDGRYITDLPAASTSQPGIVQLSSSINSTATNQAATPSAAKAAYDRGTQGVNAAAAAQDTADGAVTAAAGAQSTADGAAAAAAGAQGAADDAAALAGAAGAAAAAADTKASNAQSTADTALATAQSNITQLELIRGRWPHDRNLIQNSEFYRSMWKGNGYHEVDAAQDLIVSFTADRWVVEQSWASGRRLGIQVVPCTWEAFRNAQMLKCNQTSSVGATDFLMFSQYIEGQRARWAMFGSSQAMPLRLSFYARTVAGAPQTITVCLRNGALNRTFVTPITLPAAGPSFQRFEIQVPADTGGTWNWGDPVGENGYDIPASKIGLSVHFVLAAGSNWQSGVQNAWRDSGNLSTIDQDNFFSSTTNQIELTGIQLEPGIVATPYQYRDYLDIEQQCNRFCQQRVITIRGIIKNDEEDGALHYVWDFSPHLRDTPWFIAEVQPPVWSDRVSGAPTVNQSGTDSRQAILQVVRDSNMGMVTYMEGRWYCSADLHAGIG